MSIITQITSLVMNAYDKCADNQMLYKDLVSSVNHGVELRYGSKVSEEVANFVSTDPVSDKIGEANKLSDYITQNCNVSEKVMKMSADYSQNIYDSLDIYKHTTPHAIPEFGELSIIMVGLSFVGIVGLQKRHEIISAFKKLKSKF